MAPLGSPRASIWCKPFALALYSIASMAFAGEQSYIDYARVLRVDPISDAVAMPVKKERCDDSIRAQRADEALAGDVRTIQPDTAIGAAITEEIRHRERTTAMRRCRLVTTYETSDQIVAYRVQYIYGGDIFVRRMDKHPGARVRVRVNLNPM